MLCKEHYRIYSKEYDSIDTKDMPRLLSSYSLAPDVIDIERYYTSSHHKDQDIIDSIQQDTSLPKGNYYLYTKDIEQSLKIQTDFYTRVRGYNALNICTSDTNTQYKISYYNNPLDNIPYPKGTTFLTTPNTPIPTYHTDERVKIFLKGSKTYKDFILNLKQKIDSIQSQYEIERVRLEVGYDTGEMVLEIVRKWEYRGYDNPNKWATMSQFKLLKNDIELLSGGIVEPAGINPNPKRAGHNLSPEQQQKTSGSDTRIPVGEYEVFWRYSGKQVYARSTIDLEFINLLKLNGVCSKNDVRDFSINPHSVNKGKNQLYDSQRQKTLQSKTDNFKKQHDWDIHSHIMPELKAINGTDMGDRNYILIHNGDNGIWSDGCLLPGELENELEPKGHKNNDGLYQETLLKTMQLIKLLIEHDIEAYQNYAKGQSKSTIKKIYCQNQRRKC